MFGGLFFAAVIASAIGTGLINNAKDNHYKKTRRIEGTNLYIDHRQISRDITTNEIMSVGRNEDNDRCLYNDVFHEIRNLDKEERERQFEKLKKQKNKGITVFQIDKHNYTDVNVIKGYRYKDFETGKDFVIRRFKVHWWDQENYKEEKFDARYYMDLKGNLIRSVDGREKISEKQEKILKELWEKYKRSSNWKMWTNDNYFIDLDMWTTK